jgi:hypothetical protein
MATGSFCWFLFFRTCKKYGIKARHGQSNSAFGMSVNKRVLGLYAKKTLRFLIYRSNYDLVFDCHGIDASRFASIYRREPWSEGP